MRLSMALSRIKGALVACAVIGTALYVSLIALIHPDRHPVGNVLDGCYHVYLDVGSNIGVQVRKLYEPDIFPEAPILKVFEKHFGPIAQRRTRPDAVCAIGFEPNPHHTLTLKDIQDSYRVCGWNVKFMTETAVSSEDSGTAKFYTDSNYGQLEWGGGIQPPEKNLLAAKGQQDQEGSTVGGGKGEVRLFRLSQFILDVVRTRRIPSDIDASLLGPPMVLVKMDIEGSEIEVMPDLIFTGALGSVNKLMIEYHGRMAATKERKKAMSSLSVATKALSEFVQLARSFDNRMQNFEIINMDDESYHKSRPPLPVCGGNQP